MFKLKKKKKLTKQKRGGLTRLFKHHTLEEALSILQKATKKDLEAYEPIIIDSFANGLATYEKHMKEEES